MGFEAFWSQASFVSKSMGIGLLFEPFDQTRSVRSLWAARQLNHLAISKSLNLQEWLII
jgi:hypothetical protein